MFIPIVKGNGIDAPMEKVVTVVGMMKDRVSFMKDLWDTCKFFFVAPESYDEKTVKSKWKADTNEKLQVIVEFLQSLSVWNALEVKEAFSAFMTAKEWGFGAVMVPIRLALVGGSSGPDLFEIFELIGKDETISRIKTAISKIQ